MTEITNPLEIIFSTFEKMKKFMSIFQSCCGYFFS